MRNPYLDYVIDDRIGGAPLQRNTLFPLRLDLARDIVLANAAQVVCTACGANTGSTQTEGELCKRCVIKLEMIQSRASVAATKLVYGVDAAAELGWEDEGEHADGAAARPSSVRS